jgi:hypothetical protein
MYGQGYDGASNMACEFKGVQKIINDKFPKALYVHCSPHSLNLAVSSSSNITPIRNCLGIVEKLHVFLIHLKETMNCKMKLRKLTFHSILLNLKDFVLLDGCKGTMH